MGDMMKSGKKLALFVVGILVFSGFFVMTMGARAGWEVNEDGDDYLGIVGLAPGTNVWLDLSTGYYTYFTYVGEKGFEIDIKIKNYNTTNNVTDLTVTPVICYWNGTPVSLNLGTFTPTLYDVGKIPKNSIAWANFTFDVANDAKPGTYNLTFRFEYKIGGGGDYKHENESRMGGKEIALKIQNRISLAGTNPSPIVAFEGDTWDTVTVTINNDGPDDIEKAYVNISKPEQHFTWISTSSGDEAWAYYPGTISGGGSQSFDYIYAVGDGCEPGRYNASWYVEYYIPGIGWCTEYGEDIGSIIFNVHYTPVIEIEESAQQVTTTVDAVHVNFTLTFVNTGNVDLHDITADIHRPNWAALYTTYHYEDGTKVPNPSELNIGDLAVGETKNVDVHMVINHTNEISPGTHYIFLSWKGYYIYDGRFDGNPPVQNATRLIYVSGTWDTTSTPYTPSITDNDNGTDDYNIDWQNNTHNGPYVIMDLEPFWTTYKPDISVQITTPTQIEIGSRKALLDVTVTNTGNVDLRDIYIQFNESSAIEISSDVYIVDNSVSMDWIMVGDLNVGQSTTLHNIIANIDPNVVAGTQKIPVNWTATYSTQDEQNVVVVEHWSNPEIFRDYDGDLERDTTKPYEPFRALDPDTEATYATVLFNTIGDPSMPRLKATLLNYTPTEVGEDVGKVVAEIKFENAGNVALEDIIVAPIYTTALTPEGVIGKEDINWTKIGDLGTGESAIVNITLIDTYSAARPGGNIWQVPFVWYGYYVTSYGDRIHVGSHW
ncbi:MAG: hypothetical protein DRN20_05380, partial [Thermoplasmata archaeon]